MLKKKVVFSCLGIAIIGTFFYIGIWPFILGGSRMETFCTTLHGGLSIAEVENLARNEGYRLNYLPKEQRAFVHEPRSMGRFICNLELSEERLKSAKYFLND